MYAIIRAGGHQEKVTAGEQITVDRLKEDVGADVTFVPLLVSTDDGTVVTDKDELAKAAVKGTVVEHFKGEKVHVFHYRNKTNYRKHTGHRQPLTLVEIAEIRFGDTVVTAEEAKAEADAAAAKAAEERKAAAEARKAAADERKAKAAAKKAESKKAAPKKAAPKSGAKKTTAKKATGKKTAKKAGGAAKKKSSKKAGS